jgi:hypothetical protein
MCLWLMRQPKPDETMINMNSTLVEKLFPQLPLPPPSLLLLLLLLQGKYVRHIPGWQAAQHKPEWTISL